MLHTACRLQPTSSYPVPPDTTFLQAQLPGDLPLPGPSTSSYIRDWGVASPALCTRMNREQLFKRFAGIISFASWNVRTLVESARGDKRICRSRLRYRTQSQTPPNCHEMNRKLDFIVKELRRLRISIAGSQKTKWFGKDICNADGYTLIHSGRPLPNEDQRQRRNEGVGILLHERATTGLEGCRRELEGS